MFFKFEERVSEERCRKDGNILSCTDALTPAPQSKHVHSSQYCYVTLCFIYKTVERVHSPVFKKHLVLEEMLKSKGQKTWGPFQSAISMEKSKHKGQYFHLYHTSW